MSLAKASLTASTTSRSPGSMPGPGWPAGTPHRLDPPSSQVQARGQYAPGAPGPGISSATRPALAALEPGRFRLQPGEPAGLGRVAGQVAGLVGVGSQVV